MSGIRLIGIYSPSSSTSGLPGLEPRETRGTHIPAEHTEKTAAIAILAARVGYRRLTNAASDDSIRRLSRDFIPCEGLLAAFIGLR